VFSRPWYVLIVKNTLTFMTTQQVNSLVYTDLNRFLYIYAELSALALRSFLVLECKYDMTLRQTNLKAFIAYTQRKLA